MEYDYADLLNEFRPRLVGWFFMRVGNRDVAEDLTQRTCVEILTKKQPFDPSKSPFLSFALHWAGIILKRHRQESRNTYLEQSDTDEDGGSIVERTVAANSPDVATLRLEVQVRLGMLAIVLASPRLPHEVIGFGLVKLLEWRPADVVVEFPDTTLSALADYFEAEYWRQVPSPEVHAAFEPLRRNLRRSLAECASDPRAKLNVAHLADRIAGETILRDYFPTDGRAEEAVSRWWPTVGRHLEKGVLEQTEGPIADWLRDLCDSGPSDNDSTKRVAPARKSRRR